VTQAAPDAANIHPVADQPRVVFLKPLVDDSRVEVGEYTYYDHPERALHFEQDAVLYGFGPERLVIGRFCAIAAGVRFLLPGANHADVGPSTYPFGIFGGPWATAMDLVMSGRRRRDTIVGSDVWFGYEALVMPAVSIGHGAVIGAGSVVASDVPPYAIVAGNPARVVRFRFPDHEIQQLLRAAWWNWPMQLITEQVRLIMAGSPAELEQVAAANGLLPADG
jgi:virginiamycin A acetyltransferase